MGAAPLASAQGEPERVATLSKAEGTVMVDKGKGFRTSKANTPLNEGDRVVTLQDARAEVTFHDGCRRHLNPNNLIVTRFRPGCKAAIVSLDGLPPPVAPAAPSRVVLPFLAGSTLLIHLVSGNDDTPISGQ